MYQEQDQQACSITLSQVNDPNLYDGRPPTRD